MADDGPFEVAVVGLGHAMSSHEQVLLESVYSKEEKKSLAEVCLEFNIMRLNGREQVSNKTLSEMEAEVELYSFVEVERTDAGGGVDFHISPTDQPNGRRCWRRSKT